MSADEAKVHAPGAEETDHALDENAPQINEVLRDVLVDLHRATTEITLSMIATFDGLAMCTHGALDHEDHAAALCAELTGLCAQTADDFRIGTVNMVLTRASAGSLLLMRANDNAMLAVVCRAGTNIGFLILEAERAAQAIAAAL